MRLRAGKRNDLHKRSLTGIGKATLGERALKATSAVLRARCRTREEIPSIDF